MSLQEEIDALRRIANFRSSIVADDVVQVWTYGRFSTVDGQYKNLGRSSVLFEAFTSETALRAFIKPHNTCLIPSSWIIVRSSFTTAIVFSVPVGATFTVQTLP